MPEKYEREIDEILRRASFQPPRARRQTTWLSSLLSPWRQFTTGVSPSRLFVFGILLALLGYFVGAYVPSLGAPVSLLAVVFLFGGLVVAIRGRQYHRPPIWRGRRLDEPISYRDIWQNLKRRWDTWRGRGA